MSLIHVGTLLHFEDVGLRSVYFLDPQWLTKLMANVTSPSTAANIGSLAKDGERDVKILGIVPQHVQALPPLFSC